MIKPSVAARFCDALQNTAGRLEANNSRQVLVIGPGITDPLDCMLSILNPARMVVVEIDFHAATKLQRVWGESAVRVLHGDAANLSTDAPGQYDLVVIRHPDVERFQDRWAAVFEAVSASLRDCGFLLVSAYSIAEVAVLRSLISNVGMSLENSQSLTSQPVDLQGNDRFMLLGQKTSAA